jgi:choline dehydrogenase-like flavoprotein
MQEQNADTLAAGSTISFDVCIVGSGAAAISLAHRLIDSSLSVVLLESSVPDRTTRPQCADQQLALVQSQAMTDIEQSSCHRYQDLTAQKLFNGIVSEGVRRFDSTFLTRSRVRVYGGTTNCWGGWTRTMQPIDFTRSQLGGPWPISRPDLEQGYQEAQWLCSLGDPGKPEFPLSVYDDPSWLVGRTVSPVQPVPYTSKIRTGCLTTLHRTGMPRTSDKGLDFQLLWGKALTDSKNVQVYRNANVRSLKHTDGKVTHVHCQALNSDGSRGTEFDVAAKLFVIAAGGVETPRLMLHSEIPNKSGKLGKGFMVHPLNDWPYPGGRFDRTGRVPAAVNYLYGGAARLAQPNPLYDTSFTGVMIPTDEMLDSDIGNFRAMIDFGGGKVNINWEQKPVDDNVVRLSPNSVDGFGDPLVDLQWSIKDSDWHTLREAVKKVGEALTAPGYASNYHYAVNENDPKFLMGDHPMGATRMTASAATGVVDKNSLVFGTPNLYVASSSVFPQTGWSNPTLTIVALARRLAAHIQTVMS